MTLHTKLKRIEEKFCFTADDLSLIMDAIGVDNRSVNGNIYIDCPSCNTKRKIFIKVNGNTKDRLHWTCFKCNCQKEYYDNLIGLIRALTDKTPEASFELLKVVTQQVLSEKTKVPI